MSINCLLNLNRYFEVDSFRKKTKKLPVSIQNRVLTDSLLKVRCNSLVFCCVEIATEEEEEESESESD